MERGPGDVGNILAPEGNFDCHAIGRLVPGLPNQPQQGTGDALFDPLGGNLAESILHLLKALADDTDDIDRDRGMAPDQIE